MANFNWTILQKMWQKTWELIFWCPSCQGAREACTCRIRGYGIEINITNCPWMYNVCALEFQFNSYIYMFTLPWSLFFPVISNPPFLLPNYFNYMGYSYMYALHLTKKVSVLAMSYLLYMYRNPYLLWDLWTIPKKNGQPSKKTGRTHFCGVPK